MLKYEIIQKIDKIENHIKLHEMSDDKVTFYELLELLKEVTEILRDIINNG